MEDQNQAKVKRIAEWAMENVKNEKPRNELQAETQTQNSANSDNTPEDAKLQIEISKDQMSASIFLIPPRGGKMISEEDILNELMARGITYGIHNERIKEVIEKGIFFTKVKIATGLEPVAGQDGKIIHHFETHKEIKPRVSEDGKADYFNLDLVINVKKGQLLSEIIHPTKGKPGITITGKTVPAKDGKQVKLHIGKNVIASEDGTKYFADIDGQPLFSEDKLSVLPVLEIKGDVGTSTGNINFLGSVLIKGNVKSGFKIKAEGDVEVEGAVEAAEIEAGGSIVLKRGIQGRGKGLLKAGSNVMAKYIENTTVEAGKNIIVSEAVMHSFLSAGQKIKLEGRKGLLVGGTSKAGEELIAKTVGSPMATYTEIEVGINPGQKKSLMDINDKLQEVERDLNKVKQALEVLGKLKEQNLLSPDKKNLLEKLVQTDETLRQQQYSLSQERGKLELMITYSGKAKVSASNMVYSGVNIIIGNASLKLRDKIDHVTFYNYEGQIRFGPYEG